MGTSTRCVNDTYRESFLSQRRAWAAQHQPQTDLPVEEASPAPIAEKQTSADSSSYDEAGEWTVQTSRSRNNILHEYDDYDNYLPVSAVISIMADGNYKVLDEDDYQPALLKIAVHEEEEDRWLVMVYDTGRVCRIPVSQLLKRDRDCTQKYRFLGHIASLQGYFQLKRDEQCPLWERLHAVNPQMVGRSHITSGHHLYLRKIRQS
jgi:hypothetical protein